MSVLKEQSMVFVSAGLGVAALHGDCGAVFPQIDTADEDRCVSRPLSYNAEPDYVSGHQEAVDPMNDESEPRSDRQSARSFC